MDDHPISGGPEVGQARRIILAREPSFRLGSLTIEPALRRIASNDGREEVLEHRVMQVLVLLLHADGAILPRDDLIYCCWDGRIVGDDAINRVMSRLRRSSEGIGRGVFRIETVTKVGYRLVREGRERPCVPILSVATPGSPPPRRTAPLARAGGALLLALVLASVFYLASRHRPARMPGAAMQSLADGVDARRGVWFDPNAGSGQAGT